MADEYRIVGPPGAGKTTTIRSRVERWVKDDEYAAEDIVLTSFSRAAAAELAGGVPVPRENVATLHSLARRALGQQPIAEVGALAKQWDESGVPPAWRIGGQATADIDDGLAPLDGGGMLSTYALYRSKMLPAEHPLWGPLQGFTTAWEQFKVETGSMDFTDLIEMAAISVDAVPGEHTVLMVDEAQDLTPLQWMLVRRWAAHPSVERFFVVGDPAQAIFSFAGARPEEMLTPLPDGHSHVLSRSYRMPRAVQALAERHLATHSGAMMEGRTFAPRDAEGSVRRLSASWRVPDLVVADVERNAANGETSLILTTCAYMLEPTITLLRERGLLYSNPWRRSNGRWNPLGSRREGTVRTADRLVAFVEGRDPEMWTPLLTAGAYRMRGAKKIIEKSPGQWREWLRPEVLPAAEAADTDWLIASSMKEYQRPLEYAARVVRRQGAGVLEHAPLIHVGTAHSVKGGQAQHVYIFPDVSAAGADEIARSREGRDAAIRLAYVALSRAQESVTICAPAGRYVLGV